MTRRRLTLLCPALRALGRLLDLAAIPPTGGVAGSRAEEANNSRPYLVGPRGGARLVPTGVVGRALEAAADPVTLTGRQEAAHPRHGAAA
jgi:hypothetical protein